MEGEQLVPEEWAATGGSALPVSASGCVRAYHRQVLCKLKPDGQYPGTTGCGHLLVGGFARTSR